MYNKLAFNQLLQMAELYAKFNSGCCKVAVGAIIIKENPRQKIISFGANRSIPDLCKARGCMRVEKYGENSDAHRLPSDCRALHSEIDAIANTEQSLTDCTIVITRYPCEACARAIVASGISKVAYGGAQKISAETDHILSDAHIECIWVKPWVEPCVEIHEHCW